MKRAGCAGIDIGMESADPDMLVRIGKGVTVERVLDVLGWARELGIHTVVNLMFGWPDETDAELDATIGVHGSRGADRRRLQRARRRRAVSRHRRSTSATTSASASPSGGSASRRSTTRRSRRAGTRPRSSAPTPTTRRSTATSSAIRRIASRGSASALAKKAELTMAIQQRRMPGTAGSRALAGVPAAGAR